VEFSQLHQSVTSLIESVPVVRVIVAFILVFFLPGFAWSLIFFKKINTLERVAFSLGLSIALVTLAVLGLNVLLHVRINGVNALITIGAMTVIPIAIYLIRRYAMHKSGASDGE
jgi:uncharacterized membrane protein